MKKLALLALLFFGSVGFSQTSPPQNPVLYSMDGTVETGLVRGGWRNRYFKYNEQFNYYVGFDLQQLHADSNINYKEVLDFLSSRDINKVRIWLYPSFLGLPGDTSYPTTGKIYYPWRVVNNKFDVDTWDNEFWTRTKDFINYAKQKGILIEISLFTIQEPRRYFSDERAYAFNHQHNLQDFGRPTDNDGRFMLGFHNLNYTDNGRTMGEFQTALVDKALSEFSQFNNVYYEVSNEAPGLPFWTLNRENVHNWQLHWIRYISARTSAMVGVHMHGFISDGDVDAIPETYNLLGSKYWNEPGLDIFNWHMYTGDPNFLSNSFNGFQLQNQMLVTNEGRQPLFIDRSPGYPNYIVTLDIEQLKIETRYAWGMVTSGGYYTLYFGPVPQVMNAAGQAAAKVMQAVRNIVETVPFQLMSPINNSGAEIDSIVLNGPGTGWQVLADRGNAYLIYFWNKQNNNVRLNLPEGTYRYIWYDTREWKAPLSTGTVVGGNTISIPGEQNWDSDFGVVLIIEKI